jgi:fatty acid desaturase
VSELNMVAETPEPHASERRSREWMVPVAAMLGGLVLIYFGQAIIAWTNTIPADGDLPHPHALLWGLVGLLVFVLGILLLLVGAGTTLLLRAPASPEE